MALEPVTLTSNPASEMRRFLWAGVLLIVVVAGLALFQGASRSGLVALAVTVVVVIGVLKGPSLLSPTTLLLDADGLQWRGKWQGGFACRWEDISAIKLSPRTSENEPVIGLTYRPGRAPGSTVGGMLNRALEGHDRAIANVWLLSDAELLEMMQGYHRQSRDEAIQVELRVF
jgi:hypothetical protein